MIYVTKSCVSNKSFKVLSIMTSPTIKHSKKLGNLKSKDLVNHILCGKDELDLSITLKGGQSFRWAECNDKNSFRGVFADTVWTVSQDDKKLSYIVHGSLEKDIKHHKKLYDYFQLNVSLKDNLKIWCKRDSHFENTYQKVGAVRMLNQDVVENLFSFICSSNNNIIRISSMVEKLCKFFGEKICEVENQDYYNFPTIEALAGPDVESLLRKEGFGYRAGYIAKAAEKLLTIGGRNWLVALKKENGTTYEDARNSLMTLPGIGPKVADCICLMSLGHLEAIPVDTHIFQVACATYTPHLSTQKTVTPKIHYIINKYLRDLWGPLAGWAQTIIFCVKLNSSEGKNKKRQRKSSSDTKKVKTKNSKLS